MPKKINTKKYHSIVVYSYKNLKANMDIFHDDLVLGYHDLMVLLRDIDRETREREENSIVGKIIIENLITCLNK